MWNIWRKREIFIRKRMIRIKLTSRGHSRNHFRNLLPNPLSTRPEVSLRMKSKNSKRRKLSRLMIFRLRRTMKSKMPMKNTKINHNRNHKQFSCPRMLLSSNKLRARSTFLRSISQKPNKPKHNNPKPNPKNLPLWIIRNWSKPNTCPKTELHSHKRINRANHDHSLKWRETK